MSTEQGATAPGAVRSERLNVRLTADALALIRRAAAAQQQDVSAFVLGAALDKARDIMINEQMLQLTAADAQQLERMLDREPQVNAQLASRLRRARTRHGAQTSKDARR